MNALPAAHQPDLVVLSHLRWPWVWQRPQHLVSRFAAARAAAGARTFFVEEPLPSDVAEPRLELTPQPGGVLQIVLLVPQVPGQEYLGYADPAGAEYPRLLASALAGAGLTGQPDVWLYTPMALPFLDTLDPGLVIYDVMDDLAGFAGAPAGLVERQRRLLASADLVFTGGRSLHHATTALRSTGVHLFPSGVETGHYARARAVRTKRPAQRRVAGYIGVIDERIDLGLVADLAAALPDWTIRMVGPLAKVDESQLPRRANLEYPGMVDYANLPDELARFDVALMPFALNEATAKISPTKALEYYAAGLPVVSTRVADVVADYGDHVLLADTGEQFAACCRAAQSFAETEVPAPVSTLLRRREWNHIAEAMSELIENTRSRLARRGGTRADVSRPATLGNAAPAGREPSSGRPRVPGEPVHAAWTKAAPAAGRQPGRAGTLAVSRLHPERPVEGETRPGLCPTCRVPVPCPTAEAMQ